MQSTAQNWPSGAQLWCTQARIEGANRCPFQKYQGGCISGGYRAHKRRLNRPTKQVSDGQGIESEVMLKTGALGSWISEDFLDSLVNQRAAVAGSPGNLANALAFGLKTEQLFQVDLDRLAANAQALGFTVCDPGAHTFADQVPFEFRNRSEDAED